MAKSAKILPFSPTSPTKPGEKLKGRKRPKSVMAKAWETRRRNEALRKAARPKPAKVGPKKPTRKTAKQSVATTLRSEGFKIELRNAVNDNAKTTVSVGVADYFAKAARDILASTSQQEAVQRLQNIVGTARHEAEQDEQHRSSREIAEIGKLTVERIVCGFIAEVELAMTLHRGLPVDMVWNLSSYTVAKVLDALNEAGYTAKGRKPRPVKGDYENF